jgi:hypothetical protein
MCVAFATAGSLPTLPSPRKFDPKPTIPDDNQLTFVKKYMKNSVGGMAL